MMKRDACFEVLAEHRGDAVVVATYTSAFEWRRVSPDPKNFYSVGAMGQASSYGLGLAIGLPDTRVIVLDGDGSLAMNLSTMTTIAGRAPDNLVHCVVENGTYEANGSHPLPAAGTADFAGMAKAAGYASVFEFEGLNRLTAEIEQVLAAPGPVFVTLKVEPGDTPVEYDYPFIHSAEARDTFRAGIKPLLQK